MVRAHVDTQAIPALIADLRAFATDSQSAMNTLSIEHARVADRILTEIRARQTRVDQCRSALASCEPEEVPAARRALAVAEARLRTAKDALAITSRSAARYEHARARWNTALSTIEGEAIPSLVRSGGRLETYFGGGSASASTGGPALGSVALRGGDSSSGWRDQITVADGLPEGRALVPLALIDDSDSAVLGPEAFGKGYTAEDLAWAHTAFIRVVLPTLQAGGSLDDLRDRDQREGRVGTRSYADTYAGFLGGDAIRLAPTDGRFTVENGYHRIWVARQLGLDHLPAWVVGL